MASGRRRRLGRTMDCSGPWLVLPGNPLQTHSMWSRQGWMESGSRLGLWTIVATCMSDRGCYQRPAAEPWKAAGCWGWGDKGGRRLQIHDHTSVPSTSRLLVSSLVRDRRGHPLQRRKPIDMKTSVLITAASTGGYNVGRLNFGSLACAYVGQAAPPEYATAIGGMQVREGRAGADAATERNADGLRAG